MILQKFCFVFLLHAFVHIIEAAPFIGAGIGIRGSLGGCGPGLGLGASAGIGLGGIGGAAVAGLGGTAMAGLGGSAVAGLGGRALGIGGSAVAGLGGTALGLGGSAVAGLGGAALGIRGSASIGLRSQIPVSNYQSDYNRHYVRIRQETLNVRHQQPPPCGPPPPPPCGPPPPPPCPPPPPPCPPPPPPPPRTHVQTEILETRSQVLPPINEGCNQGPPDVLVNVRRSSLASNCSK
ncbi:pupal cuticle protein 36a-like [Teleopsis dalmanni]|uniref:pupal cuticle protein 36a-like n=1 Tax=Teleopsis dalmanni TaxID=139649 RepID=UPI0018CD389B|nr:pupal cuticle protein 36a-like [Teleopsis dalmanni]